LCLSPKRLKTACAAAVIAAAAKKVVRKTVNAAKSAVKFSLVFLIQKTFKILTALFIF